MKKGLIFLGVICVCLTVLVVMKTQAKRQAPASTVVQDIIDETYTVDNVSQIMVRYNGSLLLMSRDAETNWRMQSFVNAYVNKTPVANLLQAITELEGELRSDNEAFLEDYGLTNEQAVRITLSAEDGILKDILLGRERNGGGNFMRFADDNKVYAVQNDFLKGFGLTGDITQMRLDPQRWLNIDVLRMNEQTQVTGMRLDALGRSWLDVKKEGDAWTFVQPYIFPIKADRIDSFIKTLKAQKGQQIAAVQNIDMENPDWRLTLSTDLQGDIVISRKVVGDKFYVRINEEPWAYQMFVYHFDNIHMEDWDAFESNILGFDKDTAMKVEIQGRNRREKVVLFPEAIPEAELAQIRAGHDEEMEGPIDTRRWRNDKGLMYRKEDVDRILNMIKGMRFENIMPIDKMPRKAYLTLSWFQDDQEHVYKIYPEQDEGCYPLMVQDHPLGYCLDAKGIGRWDNGLQALHDNVGLVAELDDIR